MADSLGERTFACQLAALRSEPSFDAEQVSQALRGEPLRACGRLVPRDADQQEERASACPRPTSVAET